MNRECARAVLHALFIGPCLVEFEGTLLVVAAQPLQHLGIALGIIGIKVWIFKGEILGHDPMATDRLMLDAQTSGVRPAR